jgi:hypothetical protein
MPTLAKREAVEKLIQAVRGMSLDDLLDFHNEMFPEGPMADLVTQNDGNMVRQKVLDYLGRGVEVEEILDLWNVAFPEAWNVTYDDEADTIQYLIEPDAIRYAD